MTTDIRTKALSGVIWSFVQRFGMMAILFISNVVLARLLTPEDYGCIGILMIFISLSNTFIDGGLGSALIQKKHPTNKDYSTIFYWNIFLSIILYFVLYLSSPYIAKFYRIAQLSSVLRIYGLVLIINALSIIQQNILRKQLCFKKLAIVNIASSFLSLCIAIAMATKGYGVWSLVAYQLFHGLCNAILFWVTTNWKPQIVFSTKSFKSLFNFGGFILLSNLYSTFSNEFQGLLVGRMFNPAMMGLYTQAHRLEGTIATTISSVIDQVTYPMLSAAQDNKSKLVSALKRFIQIPTFVCAPLMIILIILAKPLIVLLYSDKWIDCVPYFQILCVAGLAVCLQGAANNAIAAIGKSKVLFKWTIIKRTLTIVLCFTGISIGGMTGLIWGCVLGAWSVYFINSYLVAKHIGYSMWAQLKDIAPFILIAILVGIVILLLGMYISLNIYVEALILLFWGIVLYLVITWMCKLEILPFIINLVNKALTKR